MELEKILICDEVSEKVVESLRSYFEEDRNVDIAYELPYHKLLEVVDVSI